ncbi:hypothetical protein SUGI_1098890 [Cryptomeria japonica]|uniref:serine/threonine-protein kinase D6PKL2 n=1 Tax=Cryptomeria japonica TaxID=3369 RepID=UPI002414861F|nr:serine/threonine-protein kinase D6PKL2 [Cryptomeria japonica]GLJ51704.1 hypothetical protein SUGI_1098890 [Cryptomeria japonica]
MAGNENRQEYSNITTIDFAHQINKEDVQSSSCDGDNMGISSNDGIKSTLSKTQPRPHHRKSAHWQAINAVLKKDKCLSQRHFNIIKRIGSGCAGFIFLTQLEESDLYFVLKVMNRAHLESINKSTSIENEIDVLQLLDHPFLPTLYYSFEMDMYTVLVMDYCPGGDLYEVRNQQPGGFFSEKDTRFYAAEVLIALEYLHMLGIMYRDLKPENILIKEDGHIMLIDFDLAIQGHFNPTLARFHSLPLQCPSIEDISRVFTCFNPGNMCGIKKKMKSSGHRKKKKLLSSLPELQTEPTGVHSMKAVGTYEYMAPEIAEGKGYGSAVDWWAFGVLLYDMLYGRTPFVGHDDISTSANIRDKSLVFPKAQRVSTAAKDLMKQLLVKDPAKRLGCKNGASEIKKHPFFNGIEWALVLQSPPPIVPGPYKCEQDSEEDSHN